MEQTQNNGALAQPVEMLPVPAATPPVPVSLANPAIAGKLTKEEFLEIENLSLKVQNVALQTQRMQGELIKANEMRQKMQSDLEVQQKVLSAKYGVDIMARTTQITPDGTIIDLTRLPTAGPPPSVAPAPKVD